MGLITEVTNQVFDVTQLTTGTLIYAKHSSWEDGRSGFVTAISEEEIVVQYFPKIGTITNHYIIRISEVLNNRWEIRWSRDLTGVHEIALADRG